jgi:hypothetical protein
MRTKQLRVHVHDARRVASRFDSPYLDPRLSLVSHHHYHHHRAAMDAWLRTAKPGSSVRSQKSSISPSARAAPYTKPTPKGSTRQSQTKANRAPVEEGNDEPELVTEKEIYYGYKNK